MKEYKKSTVLIIDWLKLPEYLQDIIREREMFHNDCYLEHHSEFEIKEYDKGMSIVEDYWEEQKKDNEYIDVKYKESLDNFIKGYGLELDVWLINQKIDWTDVEKILIEICW